MLNCTQNQSWVRYYNDKAVYQISYQNVHPLLRKWMETVSGISNRLNDRQTAAKQYALPFSKGGGIKKKTYYSLINGLCVYCTSKQGIKLMLDSCEKALIAIYAFTVTVFIFSGHLH